MRVSYDTEISVLVYIPENTCTNQCGDIYRQTHLSIFFMVIENMGILEHPLPGTQSVKCSGHGP